ncbi:MAG: serine/threonine-protein kinase, partial [Myxococcota bacterium]|nr:serine/threonine-protein kinase [Myxococcota bacterium]
MDRLGNRYQLLEKLGEGGEGQVWSALDRWSDDRPVAIKRLSSSGSESIQREFSALGYLRHPHIVSALDLVHDDTGTYLVEQRVFGDTLDQWVREVSLETVFEEMAPVFHALAHLHARGWVHLDPTAANILVERSPSRAVLIDLGLVQPLGASVIAGTPRFIAPELLKGEAVSPAADVYTLALALWELLKSRVDGESSAHRDIRASFELGFHQDPALRPGAYRFAQMLLELAGSGNAALLS